MTCCVEGEPARAVAGSVYRVETNATECRRGSDPTVWAALYCELAQPEKASLFLGETLKYPALVGYLDSFAVDPSLLPRGSGRDAPDKTGTYPTDLKPKTCSIAMRKSREIKAIRANYQ